MTRFLQLCEAFGYSKRQFDEYKVNVSLLVGEFLQGFRAYLQAPEGMVNLMATKGYLNGRKMPGPTGALFLDNDTYWHFGVVVDLYKEDDEFPYELARCFMRIKLAKTHFDWEILDDGARFQVSKPAELDAVYDHLFEVLKTRYAQAFKGFVIDGDPTKRYGF